MKIGLFKKVLTLALATGMVAALATGCSGSQSGSSGSAPGATDTAKTIRITAAGTPNIDPAIGSDEVSCIGLVNLYDSLVYPQNDGSAKPWIATKWDVSSDNLTYTFHLKQGVKFHSGDELTADDVVYSFNRLMTIGQGYAYLYTDTVQSVTAVDKYTVKFTLKKQFAPFVNTLDRLYILDQKTVQQHTQSSGKYGGNGDYGTTWLISNDAGSGPYKLTELKQQQDMKADKFDGYWGGWGQKAPESIELLDTTDGATVRTLINNRQLEVTDEWQTNENLASMSKISGVSINTYFFAVELNVMLNTKKAPTDDVNFRKALAYMFDYKSIVGLFPGSVQSKGPVPHDVAGFDSKVYQYNQDIAKAKEYLAKSKYANSLASHPLTIVWCADVPDEEKIALSFQASAQQIGITVNVQKAPWLSFTSLLSSLDTTPNASVVLIQSHFDEAGSMLQTRYGLSSQGTWEQGEWLGDKDLDASINDALTTMDKTQRFQKYAKIQEHIVNDLCPTIYVLDQAKRRAYQDYIDWPAADLVKQGKPVTGEMGYDFFLHDFAIK